jgi:surface protein
MAWSIQKRATIFLAAIALALTSLVATTTVASAAPATFTGAPLIVDVTTTNPNEVVELPFGDPSNDLTAVVDVTVTWGDGLSDSYTSIGVKSHTYAAAGTYTISVGPGVSNTGPWLSVFGYRCNETGTSWNTHPVRFVDLSSFGDLGTTCLDSAFYYADNLVAVSNSIPSSVTDIDSLFRSAGFFNHPDISQWNTSNVTSMANVFSGAGSFNQPLNNWDVSSVTDMTQMFIEATSFNQNLNSWNTSNVTSMYGMFRLARDFNGQISNWNTSNVTSMSSMFRDTTSFNSPIGSWNVSNVNDFNEMFSYALSFNQNIANWNTSSGTGFSGMFRNATDFNQDISSWNTANMIYADEMFMRAESFNQPIGSWTTGNLRTANRMFQGAISFNQSLANWTPSRMTSASDFIKNATAFSNSNYEATLVGWQSSAGQNTILSAPTHKVLTCAGVAARDALVASNNWTITDLAHGLNCNAPQASNPTATINGYSFESAKLNAARKLAIRRYLTSVTQNATLTCTGSTAGVRVTSFARKLAKDRATSVCNYAKSRRPDLRTRVAITPASGPTKAARKVVLSFV